MSVYNIAEINVAYDCHFPLLFERSEKYKAADSVEPEFRLTLTEEYFESRRQRSPNTTDDIFEYMGMGTQFYKALLAKEGMMLHASAVAVDGFAYLFSAPCGTGKSTHTLQWQKLFGEEKAIIINDDKPAMRKVDGVYKAYGTPFSGKHDLSVNTGYPIKGICFISRGETNSIERLPVQRALAPLFDQTIRPAEIDKMDLLCDRVDDILKHVSMYHLRCDISTEAALLAYKTMSGGTV
ncbi:MAG: hypothetical protein IJU45_06960 [Clostridia bacterium]|nr:hypothetical protein [Clostridia bacterium]